MRKWEKVVLLTSLSALSFCLLFTLLSGAGDSPTEIIVIERPQEEVQLRVNLSRAHPAEIALLPGIGEKRAAEIERKREEECSISASDLPHLIGAKTAEKIEEYILFTD